MFVVCYVQHAAMHYWSSLQVLVLSGVSAYVGLLLGFGIGAGGMVHASWDVARRLLTIGLRRTRLALMLLPRFCC